MNLGAGHAFHGFGSTGECAAGLAVAVAARLRADLEERESVAFVVSGGSTPLPFFRALARQALDWQRVTVCLADERWVPPDHADSNERRVRSELRTGDASGMRLLGL